MRKIDLHVHSNRSDGTLSPAQLVEYAMEKEVSAFALTDHDTTSGLDDAVSYAENLRRTLPPQQAAAVPEVIPGIEFSTEYQGQDIHILGLDIDYHRESFSRKLQDFVDSRTNRNIRMCRLLQQAGIDITYEALLLAFPDAVITRAHYARYLYDKGYTSSPKEAFDRYVGDHCSCFVSREKVTPVQAVELILEAGGIPVLAHPILYRMSAARLDELTSSLKAAGLLGLEAVYSTYRPYEERQMRVLAAKYDLCISGGSDFHGANKPGLDLGTGYGRLFIPAELLEKMRNRASDI